MKEIKWQELRRGDVLTVSTTHGFRNQYTEQYLILSVTSCLRAIECEYLWCRVGSRDQEDDMQWTRGKIFGDLDDRFARGAKFLIRGPE